MDLVVDGYRIELGHLAMNDNVNHPNHYIMPDGSEVIQITRWLTSNAGQAVGYIARSSRIDGVYKLDQVEDLRKAVFLLQDEIERLEGAAASTGLGSWQHLYDVPERVHTLRTADRQPIYRCGITGGWTFSAESAGCKDYQGIHDPAFPDRHRPFTEVAE